MSINGIIPEENEFFEVSMNPDESILNSSLDSEIIQMEKARNNLYFCCDLCDFKSQRKVEFKVHLLNVHESAQCSDGKCESTEEVPADNLESNLEEASPGCHDSSQSSGSDTEKASPNAEVR